MDDERHTVARMRIRFGMGWLAMVGLPMVGLTAGLAAGCSQSHGMRVFPADGGSDARDPDAEDDSVVTNPSPGCPEEPEAEECIALCQDHCSALSGCGVDESECLEACRDEYRCPGETIGHDNAICSAERQTDPNCGSLCAWYEGLGGECPPRIPFCDTVPGSTFVSVDEHECGLGADGVVMCQWRLWLYSDLGEGGSYSCTDHTITLGDREATWDPERRILMWEGLPYVREETSP
jgi:hypothetical protein